MDNLGYRVGLCVTRRGSEQLYPVTRQYDTARREGARERRPLPARADFSLGPYTGRPPFPNNGAWEK
eukprot:7397905-Heterocapsa_arctica.AAC.1